MHWRVGKIVSNLEDSLTGLIHSHAGAHLLFLLGSKYENQSDCFIYVYTAVYSYFKKGYQSQ